MKIKKAPPTARNLGDWRKFIQPEEEEKLKVFEGIIEDLERQRSQARRSIAIIRRNGKARLYWHNLRKKRIARAKFLLAQEETREKQAREALRQEVKVEKPDV